MRFVIGAAGIALALVGCGSHTRLALPSPDRLAWAGEIGRFSVASDPALVSKVRKAADASGARTLDVTVIALPAHDRHAPVVTLESNDPAAYLKHEMQGFLEQIGVWDSPRLYFVELLDGRGAFAWSAGRFPSGGMVHPRRDLDKCSPIQHSYPFGVHYPPCPAK